MAPRKTVDTVGPRIDTLYLQPSGAFVSARNALAAALRKEGQAEASERVKRLQKPSPGAWALNQVYWRDRPLYDRMIKAGDVLRALQHQMLAGRSANPRDAMADRQAAVDAVVDRAAAFLREDGNAVTVTTRQRLHTTVDAVASYGSAADGYTPGQMVDDVDAPGFAALASVGGGALRLVHGARAEQAPVQAAARPAVGSGDASAGRKGTVDRKAEREAAREREATARREAAERAKAVKTAEQALRDATRELDTARQRAARARASAEALAQEQRTAEEALARLVARRTAADASAVEATESVAAAERVRRDAEAALVAARDAAQQG
jgi:hypothetical protein